MDINNAPRELLSACLAGNLKRTNELLDWGVDPRTRIEGRSLAQHAAGSGHHQVLKALLKAGALCDREALVLAVRSGNRHSVTYVADDLHFQGQDPFSFSWAALFSDREFLANLKPEIARWLVDNGLDLTETDSMGRNLLQMARSHASAEVIAALGG